MQCAAKQSGGEESVLAVADIDEGGREGGRDQKRFGPRQDGADCGEIGCKTRGEPQQESPRIGKRCHEHSDSEEEWRIVPAVEGNLATVKGRLFRRVLERGII